MRLRSCLSVSFRFDFLLRRSVSLVGVGDVYSDRNTIIRSVGLSVVIIDVEPQWRKSGVGVYQKDSLTIARSDVTIS